MSQSTDRQQARRDPQEIWDEILRKNGLEPNRPADQIDEAVDAPLLETRISGGISHLGLDDLDPEQTDWDPGTRDERGYLTHDPEGRKLAVPYGPEVRFRPRVRKPQR
jgi:hypothetical protein